MVLTMKATIRLRSLKFIVRTIISIITRKRIAKSIVRFIRKRIVMGKSIVQNIIKRMAVYIIMPAFGFEMQAFFQFI